MFVVDLITALLLAGGLTIVFGSIVHDRHYHRWRDLSPAMWLLTLSSWAMGIILVISGVWIGHWAPFILSAILLCVFVVTLSGDLSFQTQCGIANAAATQGRTTVALYFSVTLLLFFCAISLRFYFENLG